MSVMQNTITSATSRRPWNKGKLVGPKPPLQPKHVWAIRTRLQMQRKMRDLALFNLAIDSKLRGWDVVSLKVEDIAPMATPWNVPRSARRKRGVPFVSNSPNKPVKRSMSIFVWRKGCPGAFSLAAGAATKGA